MSCCLLFQQTSLSLGRNSPWQWSLFLATEMRNEVGWYGSELCSLCSTDWRLHGQERCWDWRQDWCGYEVFFWTKNVGVFDMDVSENSGFSPQIIHGLIGFSIILTIHFGVFPYFWKHPCYFRKVVAFSVFIYCSGIDFVGNLDLDISW